MSLYDPLNSYNQYNKEGRGREREREGKRAEQREREGGKGKGGECAVRWMRKQYHSRTKRLYRYIVQTLNML